MPSSPPKKIFLVDDHPVVRRGLQQLIDSQADLAVCGEAESAPQALRRLDGRAPDLMLIDVTLKGSSGLDLTRQLREQALDVPVLVVSLHDEMVYAERALTAGAQGYIMKREPDEELLKAIHQVLAGEEYLSSDVQRQMEQQAAGATMGQTIGSVDRLSDRELEIFRLIGQGYDPSAIAEELFISVKTVESHRQNIKRKLNLDSAALLRRYAIAWNKEQAG